MTSFPYPDAFHLQAAQGWLMLGCPAEAALELSRLQPASRRQPKVLSLRCRILVATRDWRPALATAAEHVRLAPDDPRGWIHRAYCLHELRRTREAWQTLLAAARRFPRHHLIPLNLACYCCHLERFEEALFWVNRSLAAAG